MEFNQMPVMAAIRVPAVFKDAGEWRLYWDGNTFVITRQQIFTHGDEELYMQSSQHEDSVGLLGTWVTITQTYEGSAVIPSSGGTGDE